MKFLPLVDHFKPHQKYRSNNALGRNFIETISTLSPPFDGYDATRVFIFQISLD
jgi:hypothetical protein